MRTYNICTLKENIKNLIDKKIILLSFFALIDFR